MMDIYQFKALMDKGKTHPIYVFWGDEEFFIHQALETARIKLLKDADPTVATVEFQGSDISAGAIFDELRTLPFFPSSRNKLVVVEDADSFIEKNRQVLEKYVESPASHAHLICVCRKWDKRTKLAALVEKAGVSVDCQKIKDHLLANWVQMRTKHYEKNISSEAAHNLIEHVGNNLSILDKQLEKLSLYVDRKNSIEGRDIEALVGIDRNRTIFELTDAVAQKNIAQALKILGQILAHGENSVKIISLLAWQIKRLWRAKQILKQGRDESAVVSELNIVPFFAKRFLAQVKLYSEESLMKNQSLLLDADVRSKTSSFDPQMLLELLVYKLCV